MLAPADVAGAGARVRALLEAGTPVTLVVGCGRGAWESIDTLAGLRLAARRRGVWMQLVVEDPTLRALVALSGLADVLQE